MKEDLEEELNKERSAHSRYKRKSTTLKDKYNKLRSKVYRSTSIMVLRYVYVHGPVAATIFYSNSNRTQAKK